MEESSLPEESAPASFFQRFRIYFLSAAIFAVLLLVFLAGLLIGQMRKNFDRKALETEITTLKKNLQTSRDNASQMKEEIHKAGEDLQEKDANLAKIASEAADHSAALEVCQASLAEVEKLLHPASTVASKAEPVNKPYIRFSNRDCTLVAGKGLEGWKDCVRDAKGSSPKATTLPAAASPRPAQHSAHQ